MYALGPTPASAFGPETKLPRVLVWFRRDLRVDDNPALTAALDLAHEVIPVYIYAPEEEGQFQPGRCSRWWLNSSLRSLDADLRALGSRLLCFRAGESRVALAALVRDLGAQGVVFNHLYDPISMVRDNEVKGTLASLGVFCRSFNGDVLREPWEVMGPDGEPLSTFTSFWATHCAAEAAAPLPPPLPAPTALPPVSPSLAAMGTGVDLGIMTPEEELSNSQLEYHWHPGSEGARRLLKDFIDGRLRVFDADRAKTDRNSTSRLSPHIHFGEVSARSVAAAAAAKQAEMGPSGAGSVADFLRQLGYREYSRYLSFHFPFTHERALLEHLRAVPWRFDQSLFKAWRTGTTGHPLVDAGMREVWSTGWMHNRLRVVCASFLVKHLLLPWQWGLKHYWDALLDADLECDALGWQYCAGCLVDGHDFSKLTDLATEAKRFDPTGNYVRRWLPVLARLPAAYIHTPWAAPPEVLADAGVELGVNYPWPVIEEGEAAIALAAATEVVNTAIGEEGKAAKAPYLPPTRPDPAAADRVWGAAATDAVPERGANVVHKACLSLNSTDETQSEEVQSNAFALESFSGGRCVLRAGSWTTPLARTEVGGAVSGNPAAAAARAARHVGRPIQSNGVAEAELMLIEEDGGVEMDTNGATGSKSAGGQDGASAGVDGCGGTSGGARGSGGSNPATNTVAVVPTISEAPSGAKVPELVPPEGGRAAGEGGGRLHGAPGPRRRSSGLRSVGVNGAMQIFDSVNGVAAAQGPAVSTDEDVAWPPDQKRHKARSDGY